MEIKCKDCGSDNIMKVESIVKDCFYWECKDIRYNGYVNRDELGGGDYLTFSYCLNCGKMQSNFPIPFTYNESIELIDIKSLTEILSGICGDNFNIEYNKKINRLIISFNKQINITENEHKFLLSCFNRECTSYVVIEYIHSTNKEMKKWGTHTTRINNNEIFELKKPNIRKIHLLYDIKY